MVQNVHSNRTSADITQDTRFKCKHEKLMKSVNVHKNIKSIKKRSGLGVCKSHKSSLSSGYVYDLCSFSLLYLILEKNLFSKCPPEDQPEFPTLDIEKWSA